MGNWKPASLGLHAVVAQQVRASPCQGEGRRFEAGQPLEVARWGYQVSSGRLVRESRQSLRRHSVDPLATGSTRRNLVDALVAEVGIRVRPRPACPTWRESSNLSERTVCLTGKSYFAGYS
jgi:hypothetical protein